ncbi:hypothetical protein [Georgenia sp. SYP-B2076]|uniref:hypothetical protein n=1 Tax=Georgenia sp. SYP-B2076 TaxID=2495881 RepID=UPI000F8DDC90|nr:hypothetical protein [Georgenia sp. SYP-B2076]
MGDLPVAAKTRVRAMTLWFVGSIVLVGVLVAIYAALIGFDRVTGASVEGVAVTGDGHDLVVEYIGGRPGCGDPDHIDVEESAHAVVISAYTVARHGTRAGFACPAEATPMLQTVRLRAPLGDREVRDGARDGSAVVVRSLTELTAATG